MWIQVQPNDLVWKSTLNRLFICHILETGDIIEIDIPDRSINVALSDEELARRHAAMALRGQLLLE
jgi:hypothetical protein